MLHKLYKSTPDLLMCTLCKSCKLLMCPACALLKAKKSSGKAQLPSDQHISGEPVGPWPGAWDELIQKPKKVGVRGVVNVETLATDSA